MAMLLRAIVKLARWDFPKILHSHETSGLAFSLTEYLELVDWTGRIIRDDKKGVIKQQTPPILSQIKMDTDHWLYSCQHFENRFKRLVGSAYALRAVCKRLDYQRTPGLRDCLVYFS